MGLGGLTDENEKKPNERRSRLIGYIKRFYDSLNYDELKSKGYPIGSGEIESAHKSVPQKRLKIPGAGWMPESINPMLSLRILRANGWWEDFWNQRTEEGRTSQAVKCFCCLEVVFFLFIFFCMSWNILPFAEVGCEGFLVAFCILGK
jgi:nitrate reductase NapE component